VVDYPSLTPNLTNDCCYQTDFNPPTYPKSAVATNFIGFLGNCKFLDIGGITLGRDSAKPLDPKLDSASNAGKQRTFRPATYSPLRAGYSSWASTESGGSSCPTTDQRAQTRYSAPYACDIGAIEGAWH
jgi:hypothetical protein